MADVPVLTIDGPSGSGKGTVGQRLARLLGWNFLDSGALYRLLGLAAERVGIPLTDPQALADMARHLQPQFLLPAEQGPVRVLWKGEDVSEALRSEGCGQAASRVAVMPTVREALLASQRALRQPPGLVADGRDMGSVVFPDAVLKVFLTASREERAQRRYAQLKALGVDANLNNILQQMAERDERDSTRSVAPLQPSLDAVTVDTTRMQVDEVCDEILRLLGERLGLGPCAP